MALAAPPPRQRGGRLLSRRPPCLRRRLRATARHGTAGGGGRGVPTNHPCLDQRPTGDLRTRLPPPRALRRLRSRADGDDARVPPWRPRIENAPPVPPGPGPKPRNLDPSAVRRPRPGRPPRASGYSTLLPPPEGGGGINVSTTRTGPAGSGTVGSARGFCYPT